MSMHPNEIALLYEASREKERQTKISYTNHELVHALLGLSKKRVTSITRTVGEVFMRPTMAMRYQLLPALAHMLAGARPCPGTSPLNKASKTNALERSLALLLELTDPAWKELPQDWVYLGSVLESNDLELARDILSKILAGMPVRHPMRFLRDFSQPGGTDWLRHFWLSSEEYDAFIREKQEVRARIDEDKVASAPKGTESHYTRIECV